MSFVTVVILPLNLNQEGLFAGFLLYMKTPEVVLPRFFYFSSGQLDKNKADEALIVYVFTLAMLLLLVLLPLPLISHLFTFSSHLCH